MKAVIVYTHVWNESFNHHILETTVNHLEKKGDVVDVIDLHADGFNPAYTQEDLRLFSRGEYADPLAADYIERLKVAEKIVFIFPIWWFNTPGMLKGFLDKVLLKSQAYDEIDHKLTGLLNINEGLVLTTANISKENLAFVGDPIQSTLINGTLDMVGIKNVSWIHCQTVHLPESREQYLKEISDYFDK